MPIQIRTSNVEAPGHIATAKYARGLLASPYIGLQYTQCIYRCLDSGLGLNLRDSVAPKTKRRINAFLVKMRLIRAFGLYVFQRQMHVVWLRRCKVTNKIADSVEKYSNNFNLTARIVFFKHLLHLLRSCNLFCSSCLCLVADGSRCLYLLPLQFSLF